jgi:hypothetical protein
MKGMRMEKELAELREAVKLLAITISEQGGTLHALMSAMHGLCYEISLDARQRAAAEHFLELGMASALAENKNEHFVQGYQNAAEFLPEALNHPPSGLPAPPAAG